MATPTETRAKLERARVLLEQRRAELLARFPVAAPMPIDGLGPAAAGRSVEFRVIDSDGEHDDSAIVEATYSLAGPRAWVAVVEFLIRDIATWCTYGAYPCYRVFVDATGSETPLVLRRDGVEVGLGPDELGDLAPSHPAGESVGLDIELS